MFFGAFTAEPRKTPHIIFDIGGTSVGGALVLLSPGERPFIVHGTRRWLRPLEEVSMERLAGLLETAVEAVAEDLLSLGKKRLAAAGWNGRFPRTPYCFVAAPWYASQIDTVRIHHDHPFAVTHGMIERVLEKEKKAITARVGGEGTHSPFVALENQILSFSVNGYETDAPYGQSGNDLEFSLYTALAEEKTLARFSGRIMRVMHADEIKTHSFLLAFFSAIRDSEGVAEDFLLVDVSGEVTEISVVRNNRLTASVSYPLGRNFFARTLAREAGVSFDEAFSFLAVHTKEEGNDALAARFRPALLQLESQWMKQFEESLTHIAGEAFLPHSVFVAADSVVSPWVKRGIQNEELYQYTLAAKPFVVNVADATALAPRVVFGPGVEKDPFLMIDALFLEKIAHGEALER